MEESLKQYIIAHFEEALEKGWIQPYYQPVIRTISGQLCSFEALARWIDPVRGFLRPDMFISTLEEAGLIHLLDSHIIREVCRRIRRSIDRRETPIPVSVNLSRLDFTLCDIFSVVDQHVSDFQLPRDYLYIEITESMAAEQPELIHAFVDRFHAAGYQVWMDDFGSGYSSLNMLKDFVFEELKLDMCFLSAFSHQRCRRIMTSIIQMAKNIDIHTLAEGVETEEEYVYLRNIGCEKVQGYYFGKPLPFDEAIAHLKEKNIEIELPRNRKYYDELGRVNFLSAAPFLSPAEQKQSVTGLELNSIPLALAEMRKDSFTILFCNAAFEQNAGTTILLPDIFRPEQIGRSHPYSLIPGRVVNLLESTKTTGEGRMLFVSNEDYYELKTKCMAKRRGAYSVLLQLNNLSEASQSASTSHLDEGLRQIYSIFERISLLNLNDNTVTPLYTGMKGDLANERVGIQEIARSVAEKWIYHDDQDAFIRFWNPETLSKQLDESVNSSLSAYFRCLVRNGRYEWKQFIMVRYQPGMVLELVRGARKEMEVLEAFFSPSDQTQTISDETLWQNLVHTDVVHLFWKDKDRRFLGVNQGFLNYYGFSSAEELIGKNDEDLGWHVHPDLYMNDEFRVINEGVTIRNIPGKCISNGENREIMASKTPLYDFSGDIIGLLGCFVDRELLNEHDVRGADTSRLDEMTGLLNSRGLREQAQSFRDEFFLRNTDFMCLYVSLDDIADINREYGFDFGDKVIAALGVQLKKAFGITAAIGRINGYQFMVMRQIRSGNELSGIRATIKGVADSIREIDGVPLTLYLSIGYSLFSESKDLDMMAQSAEMRLLVDHDDHAPVENRQSGSSDFFRLYDDLPISYAVYKVHANRKRKVTDAEIFYANHLFERRAGKLLSEMLGRSVRELFPATDESWFDIAGRAAMQGETIVESMYFAQTGLQYYMTATQIIRPGFCSFTYQEIDLSGKPMEPTAT